MVRIGCVEGREKWAGIKNERHSARLFRNGLDGDLGSARPVRRARDTDMRSAARAKRSRLLLDCLPQQSRNRHASPVRLGLERPQCCVRCTHRCSPHLHHDV